MENKSLGARVESAIGARVESAIGARVESALARRGPWRKNALPAQKDTPGTPPNAIDTLNAGKDIYV